jgi:hypothetical protein
LIVTENTKYALRVANPNVADRLARGWPPKGWIVMTTKQPSNYYPFSICLIMATLLPSVKVNLFSFD